MVDAQITCSIDQTFERRVYGYVSRIGQCTVTLGERYRTNNIAINITAHQRKVELSFVQYDLGKIGSGDEIHHCVAIRTKLIDR